MIDRSDAKLAALALLYTSVFLACGGRMAAEEPEARLTVCHEAGTPEQRTLTLLADEARRHVEAHGDTLGACEARFEDRGLTIYDRKTGFQWAKLTENGGFLDRRRTYTLSATGKALDGTLFTEFLPALDGHAGHPVCRETPFCSRAGSQVRCSSPPPGGCWRLPQLDELRTLVDCSFQSRSEGGGPCTDTVFFPLDDDEYWSGTSADAEGIGDFSTVDFGDGGEKVNANTADLPTLPVLVRFEDWGETVYDNLTGLEWVKHTDDEGVLDKDNRYSWSTGPPWNATGTAFTEYLPQLNGFQNSDSCTEPPSCWFDDSGSFVIEGCNAPLPSGCWRLPELDELESILKCSFRPYHSACISPIFGPTPPALYSSATTFNNLGNAFRWWVDFDDGDVRSDSHLLDLGGDKRVPLRVRAVRECPIKGPGICMLPVP